jgi:hypothetical protein
MVESGVNRLLCNSYSSYPLCDNSSGVPMLINVCLGPCEFYAGSYLP